MKKFRIIKRQINQEGNPAKYYWNVQEQTFIFFWKTLTYLYKSDFEDFPPIETKNFSSHREAMNFLRELHKNQDIQITLLDKTFNGGLNNG